MAETLAAWVSRRSTSAKAMEPASVSRPVFSSGVPSARSATEAEASVEAATMTGASLVPVRVRVAVRAAWPPWPSLTR